MTCRKKPKNYYYYYNEKSKSNPFDKLPDDLVISILTNLSSSSSSPSDFINSLLVCKRFNGLGMNEVVLSKASSSVLGLKAKNWCESAHRFLMLCVDAGSLEASYFLGMIRFYCLGSRKNGASLMAKAAIKGHAPALFSLSVIHFNGSGGLKNDRNLRCGVALCARAACFGYIDAYWELGHCLQDGYGVKKDVPIGRRLLLKANALEVDSTAKTTSSYNLKKNVRKRSSNFNDFGCNVPHPANRFLVEWFELHGLESGLRLCSHTGCGRPETRPHEFRKCSVCGAVNYCSRACQAKDWKMGHNFLCGLMALGQGQGQWVNVGLEFGGVGGAPLGQHEQVVR